MILATRKNGRRDGELMIVSHDHRSWAPAEAFATLQAALEDWDHAVPWLQQRATALDVGELAGELFAADQAHCPLPRAYQWLDASSYFAHGRLMMRAFKQDQNAQQDNVPLMYQGASDRFIAPTEPVPFPSEADGIDFEGEFAVVTGEVPMGISATEALSHIRLLLLVNDWSCRALAPREMKAGFGFIQAKPASSFAPFAITPDELGPAWRQGRIDLAVHVWRNQSLFGAPPGISMDFDFGELIAHAARTRTLSAGTIIGSGTVSAGDPFGVGGSCIAEMRGGEMIRGGDPETPYLQFGERVRIEARAGSWSPFGALDQVVVRM